MPVTACNRFGFFFLALTHTGFQSVADTRSVSDDERRTRICFGFADGFQCLSLIGAHCNLCYVYIAVSSCHQTEIFFAYTLAGCGKFRNGAHRSCLRRLTARIGINLCVENKDVHIFAGSDYVVETP
ncbi:hypothetical protein JCM6292_2639 [Bacteroides pyogenes JCM 6292]|uniref:Uncharacterized protein n=1 Tax=Bacteroides pyogenes JCM 6292 TaxID=1235809 RepID=W4P904_9BACE|nr:hypothetical protein JCM6292_2639 [Bacteroides pyogenes JCM 6292]